MARCRYLLQLVQFYELSLCLFIRGVVCLFYVDLDITSIEAYGVSGVYGFYTDHAPNLQGLRTKSTEHKTRRLLLDVGTVIRRSPLFHPRIHDLNLVSTSIENYDSPPLTICSRYIDLVAASIGA